jgi:hypothetical protein
VIASLKRIAPRHSLGLFRGLKSEGIGIRQIFKRLGIEWGDRPRLVEPDVFVELFRQNRLEIALLTSKFMNHVPAFAGVFDQDQNTASAHVICWPSRAEARLVKYGSEASLGVYLTYAMNQSAGEAYGRDP